MDSEFLKASERISNIVDFLLTEDGLDGWELDKFQITKMENNQEERVECEWVKIDGKWELVCKKV